MSSKDNNAAYGAMDSSNGSDEMEASSSLLPTTTMRHRNHHGVLLHSHLSIDETTAQQGPSPLPLSKSVAHAHAQQQLHLWGFATGLSYTLVLLCGMVATHLRYERVDYDSAETTAELLRQDPDSFRRVLLFDVGMSVADVLVAILLAHTFWLAGAHPVWCVASSVFRFLRTMVLVVNGLHWLAASLLLDVTWHPTMPVAVVFQENTTTNASAVPWTLFFLSLHKYGIALAALFLGISLLFLGMVIATHQVLLPRWWGCVLLVAGYGHIMDTLLSVYVGSYNAQAGALVSTLTLLAEGGLVIWLLIQTPVYALKQALHD